MTIIRRLRPRSIFRERQMGFRYSKGSEHALQNQIALQAVDPNALRSVVFAEPQFGHATTGVRRWSEISSPLAGARPDGGAIP